VNRLNERQHYVSQVQLERFKIPGSPLQCYQVETGDWKVRSVEKACAAGGATLFDSCANWLTLRTFQNFLLDCELKRKKQARQKEEDFHHNVYVVLLSDAVTKHRSILRLNPKRDPLKPCVYVGMTGIPVDHRFDNHKHGYKSAWVVRRTACD
jgi:hypothetical protein